MIEIISDIWLAHGDPGQRVIKICPTNGYVNKQGEAVMGAGIAKELAQKYSRIPRLLGTLLQAHGNKPYPLLIEKEEEWWSFPVKHKWDEKADPQLILLSLVSLKRWLYETASPAPDWVIFPRVGCGNGKLSWEHTVRPMMLDAFDEDNRVIVVALPF